MLIQLCKSARRCTALLVVGALWLLLWQAALAAEGHAAAQSIERCELPRLIRCGGRTIVETQNLRIHGLGNGPDALRWASQCEQLRCRLYAKWLGNPRLPVWSPKCELVLHATRGAYVKAIGEDRASTAGSASVELARGQVVQRRIDIRADRPGWLSGALAHELTHVVLADEFVHADLPLWADEGMAVLSDPDAKQRLHLRDLQAARQRGSVRRVAELLADGSAPNREQTPAFYGQSLSLVKFLVDRKTPAHFVYFLHRAGQAGYDAALQDCYGLGGVADLEKQWRQSTCAVQVRRPSNTTDDRLRSLGRVASVVRP